MLGHHNLDRYLAPVARIERRGSVDLEEIHSIQMWQVTQLDRLFIYLGLFGRLERQLAEMKRLGMDEMNERVDGLFILLPPFFRVPTQYIFILVTQLGTDGPSSLAVSLSHPPNESSKPNRSYPFGIRSSPGWSSGSAPHR